MAKFTTQAVFCGTDSREYNGKTYNTAHLAIDEEGSTTTLPITCTHEVLVKLKKVQQYSRGVATIALKSIKGNTFLDLHHFEPSK